MRRVVLIAAATAFAVILSLLSVPAQATWPGRDGRIAFVRANQIYTIRPDGTGLSKRTYVGKNYRPEWSPSGQRIAYIHESAAGVREVWVMRADGSAKTRITQGGNATAGPSWSPDGRWLAFADANGILVKVRTTAPASVRGDKSPAPSPSGRYMAFVNDSSGIAKIYIAKADGSSRRQLTYGYQPDWQRLS